MYGRRIFVSGIAVAGLAACAGGGFGLVSSSARKTDASKIYCDPANPCGKPSPTPISYKASSSVVDNFKTMSFAGTNDYANYAHSIVSSGTTLASGPIVVSVNADNSLKYNYQVTTSAGTAKNTISIPSVKSTSGSVSWVDSFGLTHHGVFSSNGTTLTATVTVTDTTNVTWTVTSTTQDNATYTVTWSNSSQKSGSTTFTLPASAQLASKTRDLAYTASRGFESDVDPDLLDVIALKLCCTCIDDSLYISGGIASLATAFAGGALLSGIGAGLAPIFGGIAAISGGIFGLTSIGRGIAGATGSCS